MSTEENPIVLEISEDGRTMTFTHRETGEIVGQFASVDKINFNDWTSEQRVEFVTAALAQIPEDEGTPENPLVTSFHVVPASDEDAT